MDTEREQALLRILSAHLKVTEQLLDHYIKIAAAVQKRPEIASNLPLGLALQTPTMKELHDSTAQLHQ